MFTLFAIPIVQYKIQIHVYQPPYVLCGIFKTIQRHQNSKLLLMVI